MTKQKDLKRVVRTRMQKTGESYTAARVHVVGKRGAAKKATAAPAEPAPDYSALSGMSDETILAKTGADWATWTRRLDAFGATEKPHRDTVEHVHEQFGISGWWSQSVTVGYERIRGLRAIGQRRGGAYEATKSKTFAVPLPALFAAWTDARARRRWLPGIGLTVRGATPYKTVRITWDDGTSVVAGFMEKGPAKSAVAVQHSKLPDRARADELKSFWSERFAALDLYLSKAGR